MYNSFFSCVYPEMTSHIQECRHVVAEVKNA